MKKIEAYTNVLGKLILILSLFSSFFVSGIYGLNLYGSIFNYALFALFIIYGIFYLISIKQQFKKNDVLFYCVIALLILNLISILLNNEKIFNLKLFIITAIQWIVVFQYGRNEKQFTWKILGVINILIFLTTLISLILFILNITITDDYIRYCGIYANTNMGSAIMAVSIAISIIFLKGTSIYKKIFLIINIILQVLLIRLCMSRASLILMCMEFVITIFLYYYLVKEKISIMLRNSFLILLAVFSVYNGLAKGLYYMHDAVAEIRNAEKVKANKTAQVLLNDDKLHIMTFSTMPMRIATDVPIGEERDPNQTEASNAIRLDLIKYGLISALKHPVLGVGQKNVANVVNKEAGKQFNGIEFGGVHNTYVQIAVAYGFPALLVFIAIQLLICYNLFKQIKRYRRSSNRKNICRFSALTALYLGFLVYGLFESILILNSAILTYMFALVAGGVYDEVSNV